jgi:putative 4-mercaptohistidine N1-methyltranferase
MQIAIPGESSPEKSGSSSLNPYETDRLLHEYLLFHYGSAQDVLPFPSGPREALDYPVRCVREGLQLDRAAGGRALDLGCAVGRSAFELSGICAETVGIDFSHQFVRAAEQIRVEGGMDYWRLDEGELRTCLRAGLPEGARADRVRFEVGDAMDLRSDLGEFDVLVMANLIDRLREPVRCLRRLAALVRRGGQLLVTSPYTWMEDYTPKSAWLGGIERDGVRLGTLQGLGSHLNEAFELVGVKDLPFLIREHARKYQWSVAQASLWIRR